MPLQILAYVADVLNRSTKTSMLKGMCIRTMYDRRLKLKFFTENLKTKNYIVHVTCDVIGNYSSPSG